MVGNIILSFSTLASAFHLKAPLPPYLPAPEASRRRLVAAIRKLDVVQNREVKGSRQLLFSAYALSMKGVTVELEILGRTLQNAFGVIGQTPEEFEALFAEGTANHSI
ncbi:ArAE-2 domain-containing protein [Mycena venus]|uniref:ArAE-2 domain-containing protein n=1 Tax=Mycena venus TaxID=2733690 RepID=A0A8H6X6U6_9AGAR|nr:ArAE-2 domain-containing protein [Mycena venus]